MSDLKGWYNKLPSTDDDEPDAICENCDSLKDGRCINRRSPLFQVDPDHEAMGKGCMQFFPCGIRWPDADHG